jgi:DNA-binding GntR family transcriptional regulator
VPRGPDFVHADERFHRALASASGNDVAEALLADLNDRIRILRVHDFTTDDRIGATITEHLEILGCVLSRDADAAAAFMRAHVQRSALVVRERVGSALARMFEGPG